MAAKRKPKPKKKVATLTHEEASRKNIPTVEYEAMMAEGDKSPVQVAYERRNRDLDPQLVWRGKDQQDWSDLVVQASPLYIQEKVHPKVLIDDLRRLTAADDKAAADQMDLFADFNGLPDDDAKTEFYQHDANWSNRMILGDSLQVMASLAEREGLRGKVQCIYIDPPYGIKFNSNFQWSTTSRDVKDGNTDHITREPEQVKAFRDTWRDGIHSYLTYLRDRLTVARDLLTESGSIFVQIGDENVHRVRALMDEVFGVENFISLIAHVTTGGVKQNFLATQTDFVLWYGREKKATKYRQLFYGKDAFDGSAKTFTWIELNDGQRRGMTSDEKQTGVIPDGSRIYRPGNITTQGNPEYPFEFRHKKYVRPWKTTEQGMERMGKAGRLHVASNSLSQMNYLDDYPVSPISSLWTDTFLGSFAEDKIYVVQTSQKVIQRCVLMSTDPGDLVLDPTCGSGTTAYVAEQWGRRWITIDTSRVALALARARIMGARYPFYLLADSKEGQQKEAALTQSVPSEKPTHGNIRQGFVYERVPHITLKSIANNAEIDVIWENYQEKLEPLREKLNKELGIDWQEWEIPRDLSECKDIRVDSRSVAVQLHSQWWDLRIARQKEIDASIAAKAEHEYLYDKPYEDNKKVRVAGPFTVESLSPHRVLGVDEDDELIDHMAESSVPYGEKRDFGEMILENLRLAGVQQAHKEDKIAFTSLTGWPGDYICAEGRFEEVASGQCSVAGEEGNRPTTGHRPQATLKRAGIFIGPEFGTVARPDLVAAAREAADGGFDVLIACAFNFDARATDFDKLGKVPVLKAHMNADLHMADDLKNTGKGNLFVIFGEPDISVARGRWLVTSNGKEVVCYDCIKELPGLGSVEEINRAGRKGLQTLCNFPERREIRSDQSVAAGGNVDTGEHSGGGREGGSEGVPSFSQHRGGITSGSRNLSDSGGSAGTDHAEPSASASGASGDRWTDAQRVEALASLKALNDADFPLSLTTGHRLQVTVHGVDVFHPQTGEVRSDGAEGIACWFIDTDYNEESFFVRQAYFLGQNDPYKSLKTTLRAEINQEAWETLNSDTSRPFNKPSSGRIAVKVINHLGDEVMKVFRVK